MYIDHYYYIYTTMQNSIDKSQLKALYSRGAHLFKPAELTGFLLHETVKNWLVTNGLPESSGTGDHDNILGIHFITQATQITPLVLNNAIFWKLADEWEENQLIIAHKEATGELYSIDQDTQETVFVNSDLPSFLLLLDYFKQYTLRSEAGSLPPQPMSREEALQKIALLKAGKLPPANPKPVFNQKEEVKKMKAFILQTDAACLQKDNYWWSLIFEQVQDGIL